MITIKQESIFVWFYSRKTKENTGIFKKKTSVYGEVLEHGFSPMCCASFNIFGVENGVG